jgi:hypothetical protein
VALSEQQTHLAVTIDRHVNQVIASGGGDEALLVSLHDHMGTFKQLLDTCSREDMDILCQQYDGFYRSLLWDSGVLCFDMARSSQLIF